MLHGSWEGGLLVCFNLGGLEGDTCFFFRVLSVIAGVSLLFPFGDSKTSPEQLKWAFFTQMMSFLQPKSSWRLGLKIAVRGSASIRQFEGQGDSEQRSSRRAQTLTASRNTTEIKKPGNRRTWTCGFWGCWLNFFMVGNTSTGASLSDRSFF